MLTPDVLTNLLSAKRILLGYSGGLDSSVLLHLLAHEKVLSDKSVMAIHINHGLSEYADQWQEHCQLQCDQLGVKLIIKKVNLSRDTGESLEKLARDARYHVFQTLMQANDRLLTAHHQNDQAETLLLQLFRGAGLKGMSAMPLSKPLGKGNLFRPLLSYSRVELETYAQLHGLNYINDDSNFDTDFDRNYIRHKILPSLQMKWPNAVKNIARSAQHHADAQYLLDLQASQDLVKVQLTTRKLSIQRLELLSISRQRNVLRYWIGHQDYPLPSEAVLQQIIDQALLAEPDAEPLITWADIEVRRFNQALYIMPALNHFDSSQVIPWKNQYQLKGIAMTELKGKLSIRYRRGGERFHPQGRDKSQTLKKLMQEWKIPTWQRDRTPLLYHDDQLIAVIGYAFAQGYPYVE